MTRLVLMTAVLAMTPVWSAAQAPVPPAAPLPPLGAPTLPPAPPAAPRPPLAPAPAIPPMPAVDEPAFDFDFIREILPDLVIEIPDLSDLHIDVPDLSRFHVDLQDLHTDLQDLHVNLRDRAELDALVSQTLAQVRPAQVDAARVAAEAAAEAAAQAAEDMREHGFEFALRAGDAYNAGLGALQRQQYERAIEAFDRIIEAKGPRADAALYWRAFSEFKLARTDAALATVGRLHKEHPQSRYAGEAKVLEAEVRKQAGQPVDPAQLNDDEIKLLAIQGLQRTEQAVPLLEGVLNGANSLNVKRRALYVLALNSDARARDILLRYARGSGNPDLQLEAVRLLVSRRDTQTTGTVLRELYTTSPDTAVRRTIIDAYRTRRGGGTSQSPLAATASQDLAALYRAETNMDLRRHIASVMAANGAIDQVVTLIRNEQDARTRSSVIGSLNLRGNPQAAQALVSLYGTLTDADTRTSIIDALAGQQNAEALIGLARSEANVQLKTRIVRRLSEMAPQSKAAADYLMEVIR